MDMQMPVMDGVEATKQIIEFIDGKNLKKFPIIGVSSSNNDDDREKFLLAGISEFVAKPVSRDFLGNLLQKYLGN